MARKPYEVFEHTADIGLHAYGDSLKELFIHAAQGMESLMVPPEQVRIVTGREVTAEGHDVVSLLIAWLNELIFLFDTEYLLFRDFEITTISETRVSGRASGEPFNAGRRAKQRDQSRYLARSCRDANRRGIPGTRHLRSVTRVHPFRLLFSFRRVTYHSAFP